MSSPSSLNLENVRQDLYRLRQSIGQNIWLYRQTRKLTLRRLALLTGIREDFLDQFELGKSAIQLEQIALIAAALNIHPEKLFQR